MALEMWCDFVARRVAVLDTLRRAEVAARTARVQGLGEQNAVVAVHSKLEQVGGFVNIGVLVCAS